MNNTYEVIKIDEELSVGVDGIGSVGDIIYNTYNGKIAQIHFQQQVDPGFLKIIATIGKRIDNLPLIEIPDEAIVYAKEVNKDIVETVGEDLAEVCIQASIRDYKAAQSKGTYTEEDIRKAHFHGWFQRERYDTQDTPTYKFPDNWKDMDYEEREEWFATQLIQSLQKKKVIKAVVLDVDVTQYRNHVDTYSPSITDLETNTITPKEVIY